MTKTPPASARPVDPLDDFLCFSLYGAGLAMNRIYKPLLEPFGITYPQYLVLVALHARDDRPVSDLGERLQLESNTLTPLLKRLEAAGLIERRRDSRDERVVRLSLTVAGRDIAGKALDCVPGEVLEATGLTSAELDTLNRSVAKLRDSLLRR
ncbi:MULTISPECIES: MarR family winged helix-turn-helix transcriptional regulator [unclassified Sphingobium]|uniref:MarR family winged helix-turn-helix transcriptional regulator n=1 Tax=unclassified Sphingobium TaxID=2611147 RepID=UPI0035A6960F